MYSLLSSNLLDSANILDTCEFSDGESVNGSVVDSLLDSFSNSPAPSLDYDWCEQTLTEIDTDYHGFQDNHLTDLYTNPRVMNYNQYNYENNGSLNLPTFNQPMITNPSIELQQHQHHHQQQQHRSMFQQENIYDNSFNNGDASYMSNYPPLPMLEMQQPNNSHSNQVVGPNALDDLFDINFRYLEQLTNTRNAQPNQDVFRMNQSTMDNRGQKLLLDYIKQQQQQDLLSNQSSPPPTPSSDWLSDSVPSPCSPLSSHVKAEYGDNKDLCMIKRNDQTRGDEINLPGTIKVAEVKKEAQTKPKRKRNNRKQYTSSTGKPRLYKFLREILNDPVTYSCIEWVDKSTGTFKFLDSSEVARLWGYRKNKPSMKYENFARSLRTYIAKGILKKPRNKLVYCFAHPTSE